MDGPSTSAAALKEEIARLTGAIDRFKTMDPKPRQPAHYAAGRPRNNVYINPNYKPPSKTHTPAPQQTRQITAKPPSTRSTEKKDVVIGGVTFESSGRSLVRKDLATSKATSVPEKPPANKTSFASSHAARFSNNKIPPPGRSYKPTVPRRGRPMNRNMTLANNRRPNGARRRRYVDKPCPRFTSTGSCNRGLTCPYKHDSDKIAICWPFLQGTCAHSASDCPLSHDPTPERTPLCMHFANAGRCTRVNCPFPHVRVGRREGVCRDFAVLGYCEKGLDCEHQHIRECPDFAEKGFCSTKGCKLPHVIRANRNRPQAKAPSALISDVATHGDSDSAQADSSSGTPVRTAEDAKIGDDFISLTFLESDEESDEEEDEHSDDDHEEDESPEDLAVHVDD